jgi:uncharacterized peroxidase-related enzyme
MPHVSPLTDAEAPEVAKNAFKAMQAKLGAVPNIWRTMAHAPEVLQATLALNQAIHKDLDPKLRELAYLKASMINHCRYCLHYHRSLAKKAGVTDAQIEELENYEKSGAYSDVEKLAIRFAEEWTRQAKVSPELMEKVARSLTPSQVVTLAATVALANWTNKFNESIGIQLP